MVTVDEYARIRLAHRDGMSIRAIARTFHHSRHKVRQILDNAEPRTLHAQSGGCGTRAGPLRRRRQGRQAVHQRRCHQARGARGEQMRRAVSIRGSWRRQPGPAANLH